VRNGGGGGGGGLMLFTRMEIQTEQVGSEASRAKGKVQGGRTEGRAKRP
jgi:hypothetical protein